MRGISLTGRDCDCRRSASVAVVLYRRTRPAPAMALGNSVGIGKACAKADEAVGLPFMAVARGLVL